MARQVMLLQVLMVALLVVVLLALAAHDARRDARAEAEQRALAVAQTVADAPGVERALGSRDPTARLQPYAEEVRAEADVDFVVVMGLDRIRWTHPDPNRIGEEFIGDLGDAPRGQVFTQQYTGTLGPSVRAVVPVETDGEVVAMVSVGITVERIDARVRSDLVLILAGAAVLLVAGLAGAWRLGRRLRRQTHGLGEREIARMYEYYRAVLHAVREGLVLLDREGRVTLVNDEARRLLDLPEDVEGRRLDDLALPPGMVAASLGGSPESDETWLVGERALVVSSAPAAWEGRDVGVVVTLRDRTELRAVTGELETVRRLTDALRAQNHEAANRLHTVVSLVEMGRTDEAVDFATEELQVAQRLADRVAGAVEEPILAALLLGKAAEAAERGIQLDLSDVTLAADPGPAARDLVTVVGNLLDNAMEAVAGRVERVVRLRVAEEDDRVVIIVTDTGPGIDDTDVSRVAEQGWSTKAGPGRGVGLALVRQVALRNGGDLHVGRAREGGAELTVTLRRAP